MYPIGEISRDNLRQLPVYLQYIYCIMLYIIYYALQLFNQKQKIYKLFIFIK